MSTVEVRRYPDEAGLADAIAARLITHLVTRQADTGAAHVCLTGGGIGTACLAAINASPGRDSIDWKHVDIWWGDERYAPTGDPDRNETGARTALLDHVAIDPARVHPIEGPDHSPDVDESAARYAAALLRASQPSDHAPVPSFDVCLLGIGPEGHIASLFPESPAIHDDRPVVAVRNSPKPPPTRVSLTLPSINASREVWILASGAEKAPAIRDALSGVAGPFQVPAAGARGREHTLYLVDDAAASLLPEDLFPGS